MVDHFTDTGDRSVLTQAWIQVLTQVWIQAWVQVQTQAWIHGVDTGVQVLTQVRSG